MRLWQSRRRPSDLPLRERAAKIGYDEPHLTTTCTDAHGIRQSVLAIEIYFTRVLHTNNELLALIIGMVIYLNGPLVEKRNLNMSQSIFAHAHVSILAIR